ncbi:MAG: hypothetical protein ABJN36_15230 [Cyclobacteriaceae bacterium]
MTVLEEMFVSRTSRETMIETVKTDDANFQEAVRIALAGVQPACWRAAWILGHSAESNDPRLQPHADRLIETIPGKEDGYQRELLKVVCKIKLSEEQEGRLFDICMSIWEAVGKSPSVRSCAFNFIVEVAMQYPELSSEITFLTQPEYLEPLSPGIRRSVEKKIAKIGHT